MAVKLSGPSSIAQPLVAQISFEHHQVAIRKEAHRRLAQIYRLECQIHNDAASCFETDYYL